MLKYFDRTFFRFLLGFLSVLAISFSVIIITNYIAQYIYGDVSAAPTTVSDDMYSAVEFSHEQASMIDANRSL